MLQRLLNSDAFASFAGASISSYIRLIRRTSRVTQDPPGFIEKNVRDVPLIIAMWHGQGLLIPLIRPSDEIKVAIMVARHIDGDIVQQTVERFGMTTIRGAGSGRSGKDKGGYAALRACMKAIREGTTVALTADIPPGPARKAGLGLPTLAKLSGRAILPIAVVTNRYFKLGTWSGFTLNLPFSNMVMASGEQIKVPRHVTNEELERYRKMLEDSLNEVTARAYRLSGTREREISNEDDPTGYGPVLRSYVRLTRLFQPAARLLLRLRERQGKEESGRISERLGIPSAPRPDGELVWLHAASVGETIAVLRLIESLIANSPELKVLLTTGTVTSAKLAAARLPKGTVHQYFPLDTPGFMARFFDHWRPGTVILTESEIWPNLIREARTRKIPLLLVNGRISLRSFRRWRKRFKIARPLFGSLDLVLAQSERYAGYFDRLGSRYVGVAGNLKMDAAPPPVDRTAFEKLKRAVGTRSLLLAASTHEGEEELVIRAHELLRQDFPDLMTIIVPRHPDRGTEVGEMLDAKGIKYSLRSTSEVPCASDDVYVADTIGELGLFYAMCPVAFVGGSLVARGGQNPVEAIMHGAAVLTGPKVHNFEEAYESLLEADACLQVRSAEELAAKTRMFLGDENAREEMVRRARDEVERMRGALDATIKALAPYLPHSQEQERVT
jgi:3-deoxy-D-manno-octulosonic-acid transferase